MNTTELRKNFHQLIDNIDNDDVLRGFYHLMEKSFSGNNGKLWSRLTDKERNELFQSLAESENEENLISHQEMKRKHDRWL